MHLASFLRRGRPRVRVAVALTGLVLASFGLTAGSGTAASLGSGPAASVSAGCQSGWPISTTNTDGEINSAIANSGRTSTNVRCVRIANTNRTSVFWSSSFDGAAVRAFSAVYAPGATYISSPKVTISVPISTVCGGSLGWAGIKIYGIGVQRRPIGGSSWTVVNAKRPDEIEASFTASPCTSATYTVWGLGVPTTWTVGYEYRVAASVAVTGWAGSLTGEFRATQQWAVGPDSFYFER